MIPRIDFSAAHFLLARMLDPIGKLMHDMEFLNFKRFLELTVVPGDQLRPCFHSTCAPQLKKANLFGRPVKPFLVENTEEARKVGASALLCCCDSGNSGSCLATERKIL